MAKRPPASSVSENVTARPLTSLEAAVTPTRLPRVAPAAPVLVAPFPSLGAHGPTSLTVFARALLCTGANGSRLLASVVMIGEVGPPAPSDASLVMLWLVGAS